jgi:hypothetical protein
MMDDVKNVQELIRVYGDGLKLDAELTGRSESWLEGFYAAFDRVDSLINEFMGKEES